MSFWAKPWRIDKKEKSANSGEEEDHLEPRIYNEPIPDTLNLGWYYSENKNEFQMAKIAEEERATHFYVIGATGTGKTKFLEFLISQDIEKGNGFGVIDPHGDLIEEVKGLLAAHAKDEEDYSLLSEKVILIEPTNPDFTVTFNPLEKLPNISLPEQAGELISAFKKIWSDSWGVRMEDLLRNSLIALGEAELSLCEIPLFLTRRAFRKEVLKKVQHPLTQDYFQRFEVMTDRSQITWIEPVMNKINAFFSDERIRQIFSSAKSSFNFREVMDQKKILLVNLDKGKLKGSSDLLGSLIMAKIQMAAFSRSDIPPSKRTPFYLYIDEFQDFASESFSVILSEARKYGLSLIMAHQTLSQIPAELRSLILGNTGIQIYFRINRQDAQLLAKEAFEYSGFELKRVSLQSVKYWSLGEEWEKHIAELQNLSSRNCYVKHKIQGGVIPIKTVEIEPVYTLLEMKEAEYQAFLKSLPFGKKYLIKRGELEAEGSQRLKLIEAEIEKKEKKESEQKVVNFPTTLPLADPELVDKQKIEEKGEVFLPGERVFLDFISQHPGMFVTQIYQELGLSGYKGDRLKKSLLEKELIKQEETREGDKGRLAKVIIPTDKGLGLLRKFAVGKGGNNHKQLQAIIKEQAELFGWKGIIEERIGKSLESVDVVLKKDEIKVAVEISETSRTDYEILNIRKCLEAGYDYVVAVSADEKFLASFKTAVKKSFSFKEKERIRFSLPLKVKDFLNSIVSEKDIVSEHITKQKELLSTTETAELLGISKNTLYEWIIQKKIPHFKVGRLVKFKREDLEDWLKKKKMEDKEILW
ncbi:MAG: helix-turn-helix domain-containing protein [Candidatus Paceibacterota bacterium]|jgi:excisionase family DNA binding protein